MLEMLWCDLKLVFHHVEGDFVGLFEVVLPPSVCVCSTTPSLFLMEVLGACQIITMLLQPRAGPPKAFLGCRRYFPLGVGSAFPRSSHQTQPISGQWRA